MVESASARVTARLENNDRIKHFRASLGTFGQNVRPLDLSRPAHHPAQPTNHPDQLAVALTDLRITLTDLRTSLTDLRTSLTDLRTS